RSPEIWAHATPFAGKTEQLLERAGGRATLLCLPLPDPAELPEAPQVPGRIHVAPPDGEGHVAHIEIAIGVHGDTMGRDELGRPFSLFRLAEAGLQSALEVVHAHAVAQPRSIIHPRHAVQ